MEPSLVSIQAQSVIENGEVTAVHMFGLNFAHPETIRDIAQEVIDSTYGSVSHKRVAIFTHEDWQNMKRDQPKSITVRVHTY